MLPADVIDVLRECEIEPCGSRVTCNPPPLNTDRDFLVVMPDDHEKISAIVSSLNAAGFSWEGSEHYQDAAGDFMSWRRDDVNLIVTRNAAFATRHRAATYVCTRINLQNKADRIAVFQAVLYGKQPGECPTRGTPLCNCADTIEESYMNARGYVRNSECPDTWHAQRDPALCDDEGCPNHGTDHVCVNRVESRP